MLPLFMFESHGVIKLKVVVHYKQADDKTMLSIKEFYLQKSRAMIVLVYWVTSYA